MAQKCNFFPQITTIFYKPQLFLQIPTIFYKPQLFSTNPNYFLQTKTFFYKSQLFSTFLQLFSTNRNFFLQTATFFYKSQLFSTILKLFSIIQNLQNLQLFSTERISESLVWIKEKSVISLVYHICRKDGRKPNFLICSLGCLNCWLVVGGGMRQKVLFC